MVIVWPSRCVITLSSRQVITLASHTWPAYVHVMVDACPAASRPTAQMYFEELPSVDESPAPSDCSPIGPHRPSATVPLDAGV